MKSTNRDKHNILLEGSISWGLFLFVLPLFGSSLIQQLYNTVDLIFVGQLLDNEASVAVGSSSLLVTCLVGFFQWLGRWGQYYCGQGFWRTQSSYA